MTLTVAGWVFLVAAWAVIGGATIWCLYQVLCPAGRKKKGVD